MNELIARAEAAIAKWRAGEITHNLHLELLQLVQAFHAHHTAAPAEPVQVVVPEKDHDHQA